MANFRLTNTSNGSMTFVDPTDLGNTSKLSYTVAKKARLDAPKGKEVMFSRWTLKDNALVKLPTPEGYEPGDSGRENISISTTISASVDNNVLMVKKLDVHIANLVALRVDLLNGLPPQQDVQLITAIAGE